MRPRPVFGLLLLLLLAARLCHIGILWAEEDLPIAAARQLAGGRTLYHDVWFDKPPLLAWFYSMWGAHIGWPLRLGGALYALLACWLIYRFARDLWGEREAAYAALLFGFFLTFGIAAAVIPLAADLLMVAPHIAAVWLAWRGRAFWSGVMCGIALLVNVKAAFVVATCALWLHRSLPALVLGCALPNAAALGWLAAHGALADYWLQTWKWGYLYSGNPFSEHPIRDGMLRTLNWLGFHSCIVVAAAWYWLHPDVEHASACNGGFSRREPVKTGSSTLKRAPRLAAWAALSLIAVAAGWRFFPRYYFQLLPVLTLAGARGICLLGKRRWIVLILLLIPLGRFGPRYVLLARDLIQHRPHDWRDVAMDQDSRASSEIVRRMAHPGDTLFVWGFRPEIFTYTELPAATRYLESQPLTGVLADRHLTKSRPTAAAWAARNRADLLSTSPTWVVDGLGPLNPSLAIDTYPALTTWLHNYEVVARTRMTTIYHRRPESLPRSLPSVAPSR